MRGMQRLTWLILLGSGQVVADTYGAPRPEPLEPVSVVVAVDQLGGREADGPLAVKGRITQVCQNKGCWVVLAEDEAVIRVMARDHEFFLPKDAAGAAIAHGRLERRELSAEHAKHLVDEDGADASLRENPVEYRLIADGIEVIGPEQ